MADFEQQLVADNGSLGSTYDPIFDDVKDRNITHIMKRESFSPKMYKDAKGYSIGYGHFISKEELASGKYSHGISQEDAIKLLKQDVKAHDKDTLKILSKFGIDKESLSQNQLNAIGDLVYQLGYNKASKFKKTFQHIKAGEFAAAAAEAAISSWNEQTPLRARDFQQRIIMSKQELVSSPSDSMIASQEAAKVPKEALSTQDVQTHQEVTRDPSAAPQVPQEAEVDIALASSLSSAQGIRESMDAERINNPEEYLGETPSFVETVKNSWQTQTTLGVALSFRDLMDSGADFTYDSEFNAGADEELREMTKDLDGAVVEKFAAMAANKDHFINMVGWQREQDAKVESINLAFEQSPFMAFSAGIIAQVGEPINYALPYGTVAKGIGTLTKGAININRVARGMTVFNSVGRRMVVAGLDAIAEEAMIQTTLQALTPSEVENKAMIVAQAGAAAFLFNGALGFVGKTLKDRTASRSLVKTLNDLSNQTKLEFQLEKVGKLLDDEELKISTEGQISTKYRDGLQKIKDGLESDLKEHQIGMQKLKYAKELKSYQGALGKEAANSHQLATAKVLDAHSVELNVVHSKRRASLTDRKIITAAKDAGIPTDGKQFKSFKKKYINKVNKTFKKESQAVNATREVRLKAINDSLKARIEQIKNTKLPVDTLDSKAVQGLYGVDGSDLTPKDIAHVFGGNPEKVGRSAGAQATGAIRDSFKEGGQMYKFLPQEPQLRGLVMDAVTKVNEPMQISNILLNKVGLGEAIKDNWYSRLLLNKTAVSKGNNPFAKAAYDFVAPSYGRDMGVLSVGEKAQQITNIFTGRLSDIRSDLLEDINKIDPTFLGIKSRNYIENTMAKNLRDYLIDPVEFMAREDLSDELKAVYAKHGQAFDKVSKDHLKRMQSAGVVGADKIELDDNYFHRNWNNEKARELNAQIGDAKFQEMIEDGMRKEAQIQAASRVTEDSKGISPVQKIKDDFVTKEVESIKYTEAELSAIRYNQLKVAKFHFGLMNVDLEDQLRTANYAAFVKRMVKQGTTDEALLKSAKSISEREMRENFGLTGSKKGLSLKGSTEVDGTKYTMDQVLHTNVFQTQQAYFKSQNGKIAFAENGIKDVEVLDELVDSAVQFELKNNNKGQAEFLKKHMMSDIDSVRYGKGAGSDLNPDDAKIISAVKKYQFNKLLQYTGVSSLAELGTTTVEAGVGVTMREIGRKMNDILAKQFSFLPEDEWRGALTNDLRLMTGIGSEEFQVGNFMGSASRFSKSSKGAKVERIALDEMSRMTRLLAGLEKGNREIALNAMTIGLFNNINGGKKASMLFGGISNVNLAEMGLGSLEGGVFKTNKAYDIVKSAFDKVQKDSKGNLQKLNVDKWTPEEITVFANSMSKFMGHLLVDPDSMTSKGWHSSIGGQMLMQFKSFEVNAASKVTGRAMAVLGQAYRTGDYAELAKGAQKLIWSIIFGKIALVSTAAISNIGRDDYIDRVSDAIWDDDAGIANILTPFKRSSLGSGFGDLLETSGLATATSTYKNTQSMNPMTRIQQTPTGQLINAGFQMGNNLKDGKFLKASQQALKMTPFYRTMGIHVFANMYLDL